MSASQTGLLAGIALGFAAWFGGFPAFLVVAALGIVGFIVGRVFEGNIDLDSVIRGRGRDRS